jgi:hypothetical protein
MREKSRLIGVTVGSAIEYYEIEGCANTAQLIAEPNAQPKSPAIQRLERQANVASLLAERVNPAAYAFAPLPDSSQTALRVRPTVGLANL